MNQFNLNKFISNFVGNSFSNSQSKSSKAEQGNEAGFQALKPAQQSPSKSGLPPSNILYRQSKPMTMLNLKMNHLANLDRSLFIKDLMKIPKDMQELLVMIQNNLSSTKDLPKLLMQNINIAQLTELMQQNGKEAMKKLINFMAEASKQGVTDLSQIKDAIKLINASISAPGQENSQQVIKNFMLLYLPWLPLQEGVDFELEIEGSESLAEDSDMSIIILISTKNYGNIKATLTLITGNSLNIFINCGEEFPKSELLKNINEESKKHSIRSDMIFEQKPVIKQENSTRQAKISVSNLKEINPFLLLMANAVIRHTIELDNHVG